MFFNLITVQICQVLSKLETNISRIFHPVGEKDVKHRLPNSAVSCTAKERTFIWKSGFIGVSGFFCTLHSTLPDITRFTGFPLHRSSSLHDYAAAALNPALSFSGRRIKWLLSLINATWERLRCDISSCSSSAAADIKETYLFFTGIPRTSMCQSEAR